MDPFKTILDDDMSDPKEWIYVHEAKTADDPRLKSTYAGVVGRLPKNRYNAVLKEAIDLVRNDGRKAHAGIYELRAKAQHVLKG